MEFFNVYEDPERARAYSKMAFPGTYYLAYRDLPEIIKVHVNGQKALDFGCGAGRSTRFLKGLGFDVSGVDISADMLKIARDLDPDGAYYHITQADFRALGNNKFDLILSAFTFDNIPTMDLKIENFCELRRMLNKNGILINLVSAPEVYLYEWASFSTRDFPENKKAKSGDRVRIIQTDIDDLRPVVDVIWMDEDYRRVYLQSDLYLVRTYRPLGKDSEPCQWVNETKIAPWTIYVLKTNK